MLDFRSLKIRNKLRIISVFSILSIAVLGVVSNYFFRTSKMLGIIINAERVHNNTFQEGVEDYYKFQASKNNQWLDSSVVKIELANQMARNFGVIDQLLQLPENEYIDILYQNYKEAFNLDLSNAYLMASRVKLFLLINKDKLVESQKIALSGYQLGEKIKNNILANKNDNTFAVLNDLKDDLQKMRAFYHDFAVTITSLNDFANSLLLIGISLIVILLVLGWHLFPLLFPNQLLAPLRKWS